jgi:hypothetical protein
MKQRSICPHCKNRPVAVNCHRGNRIYYRKYCDVCIRNGRTRKTPPNWAKSGYTKKPQCDKCGFKFKFPLEQSAVFHVDGNLKNTAWTNLKTLCLNCVQEVYHSPVPWRPAEIVPDF